VGEEDRYRLAAFRDARELAEREKRGELAGAVAEVRAAEERLTDARTRVAALRAAVTAAQAARDAELTAARRALADRFVARRRRELDQAIADELRAEAAVDVRQDDVDLARRTHARARADRKVIERHFARWREQRHKLAERREE
jgi:hypothetical protein